MYNTLKNNWWIFALFALAFVGGLLAPILNADNLKTSILEYGLEGSNLEDDMIRFHLQLNDSVNDFLEILTSEEEPN